MTTKELERIYNEACRTKGYTPDDDQFRMWKKQLGWCERADLEVALVEHYATSTQFPMPAELRQLAGKAMRERQAKSAVPKFLMAWKCGDCGYTRVGHITADQSDSQTCHCGKEMAITLDERPRG